MPLFHVDDQDDEHMSGKGKNKKKNPGTTITDPRGVAMAQLGLNMGNKTSRNLKKEDIDDAFLQRLHDSEHTPELFVNPPRVPSKRAYQRSLHESYQLMMKTMIDAANIEAYRKKKLAAMEAATNQAINKYKDSIPSEASEPEDEDKDEEIEI